MKRVFLYTLVFTLLSCGGSQGRFRLKGEFGHLQQGEFYIYSDYGESSVFDTIRVERGEFDYQTELDGQAVYSLLYPNMSEQVIFGASGQVVTIKGDANNLRQAEVTGSEANEDMTAFRLANMDKSAAEVRAAAAAFITGKPASPVSVFLFRQYFLLPDDVPAAEVKRHYRALCEAQPDNPVLLQWMDDVEAVDRQIKTGCEMPPFSFTLDDGQQVSASDYAGKYLLINFWASWDHSSAAIMFRFKRLRREYADRIEMMSVSLDVRPSDKEAVERNDSVTWPSYCDFMAWNSPVLKQVYVPSVPYCILVGPDRKVIAAGTSYDRQILPELKKIFSNLK